MHWRRCATVSSAMHASAQAVHDWAQLRHSSMHRDSTSISMSMVPGCANTISLAKVIVSSLCSCLSLTPGSRFARESPLLSFRAEGGQPAPFQTEPDDEGAEDGDHTEQRDDLHRQTPE